MPEHRECDCAAIRRRSVYVRMLPIALLAAIVLAIWASGLGHAISLHKLAVYREPLRAWVAAHSFGAVGAYVLIYAAVVAMSLPAAGVLTLAGGFLFGWLIGGAAAVIGATIGAVAIFLLARGALAEPLARRCGPWLEKFRSRFQDNAISYLLFLRLVPVFPFWLVNLAPALLGVPLRAYVIATFFGVMPGGFAYALAGAGLDSIFVAHMNAFHLCQQQNPGGQSCNTAVDPSSLLTPELLIAFAALGVVALIPVIVKRLKATGHRDGFVSRPK